MQELYELGPKQIWISGLPPVGCLPFIRTLLGGVDRQCQENLNQAAVLFNSELQGEIKKFNANYADLKVRYLDIYNNLLHIINHPHGYGNFTLINCLSIRSNPFEVESILFSIEAS